VAGGRSFLHPIFLPIEMKPKDGAGRYIKLQLNGGTEWRPHAFLWKKELNIDLGLSK
jgi:hypothetical protein